MKKITYHKNANSIIKFRLDKNDVYGGPPLGSLAELLVQDMEYADTINFYIDWLKKAHNIDTMDSTMYQIDIEENVVSIENIIAHEIEAYDEESVLSFYVHNDKCKIFKTTKNEFLQILERWKEVITMNPLPNKIIFLEDDNGHLSIEIEN